MAKEWKIWDKEEEAAKSEAKAKKLVPEKFHKWIKVFSKKQLERMPTRKIWDHTIDMKEEFVLRKGKVYPLSREEREEVCEFLQEQLKKGYIRLSKSPQMAPVFFVGKKDGKKRMVVICKFHLSGKLHPRGDATSEPCLPRRPPFSQHVSWRCCNLPDIPSSMAEILLFNSVFHD